MAQDFTNPTVMSASIFTIDIDNNKVASFSELSGINSEVEAQQYLAVDTKGNLLHTKQYGMTKPPKVTLRRGVDGTTYMWAWHQAVLAGDPAARRDATLTLWLAGGTKKLCVYQLFNAWPSKLDIGGMKAGATEVITETVELVCDAIMMDS